MLSEVLNESNISSYSRGLIQTVRKKTIAQLSISILKSPDQITKMLNSDIIRTKENLKAFVQKLFRGKRVFIIWDDTIAGKPYAKRCDSINWVWNSASKIAVPGFQIVTCIITDGEHNIPVDCELFFSRKRFGQDKPTKSEIALAIAMYWDDVVDIERILADSHYSTKWMLVKLTEKRLPYCIKFTPNRIVTIGEKTGPLIKLLRLVKNSRVSRVAGMYAGIACFFYVVKYGETWLYYISSDPIDVDKIASVYKKRWKIEEFHRTIKQSLGFNDCQSLSTKKQHRHMFYVIEAYINVELERIRLGYKNVEAVIRLMRPQNQSPNLFDYGFRSWFAAHA